MFYKAFARCPYLIIVRNVCIVFCYKLPFGQAYFAAVYYFYLKFLWGGGLEVFVKFNKRGGGDKINGEVGISKYLLILVMNEKRDLDV